MSDIAIRVEGLSKAYRITAGQARKPYHTLQEDLLALPRRVLRRSIGGGGAKETLWALDDLSFDVCEGEVLGVIGRNGAGKSTLLKVLSRITEPTRGQAEIYGRVGSLLEVGTGFHQELTGRENVYLSGAILGMRREEITRRFDEIIEFAGVQQFTETPVKRYSSGMYMRLAFAVAAHLDTEILIVDEVLAVGDAEFQKKCLGKMDAVAQSGRTVLFVSHNIGAVRSLCTSALWLDQGRIRALGLTEDVTLRYFSDIEDSGPVVEVSRSQHIRGNGEVTIESASLFDEEGVAKNTYLIGEPFQLKLVYKVNQPIEGTFWMFISSLDNVTVLSSFQRDVQAAACLDRSGTIVVAIDDISILPGNYSIAAGVFDSMRAMVDWADSIINFEVLPQFHNGQPFDYRVGLVTKTFSWNLLEGGIA
jgi:lipopolysaccharide transport system ATP-binding protein